MLRGAAIWLGIVLTVGAPFFAWYAFTGQWDRIFGMLGLVAGGALLTVTVGVLSALPPAHKMIVQRLLGRSIALVVLAFVGLLIGFIASGPLVIFGILTNDRALWIAASAIAVLVVAHNVDKIAEIGRSSTTTR